MAEIFAIFTGALTAAEFLSTSSKSIYRTAKLAEGAQDDLEEFANSVRIFSCLIRAFHIALKPYAEDLDSDKPQTLEYLQAEDALSAISRQVNGIEYDIEYYVPILKNLRRVPKWLVVLQWVFRKREVDGINIRIESVKSNLNIVMVCIQLEVARSQPRNEALIQKINQLKREVKTHVKTIEMLHRRLEKRGRIRLADDNLHENFLVGNRGVQQVLHNLGTSMVYERRVPGYPAPQTSPTATMISTRPSSRRPRTMTSSMPSPSVHMFSRNQSREVSRRENSFIFRESASNQEETIEITPLTLRDKSHPGNATEPITPNSSVADYVAAADENPGIVRLASTVEYQAEPGYIITNSNPLLTIAKLDPDLGENIISQQFATTLGLILEHIDADDTDNDGLLLQIGEGEVEKCIGKVVLRWSTGRETWPPEFAVHCWVSVHANAVGALIFGKPFVEKKSHYRRAYL